jgi:hypothetical protein
VEWPESKRSASAQHGGVPSQHGGETEAGRGCSCTRCSLTALHFNRTGGGPTQVHAHGALPLPGMVMAKVLGAPLSGVKRFVWAFQPAGGGGEWSYTYR